MSSITSDKDILTKAKEVELVDVHCLEKSGSIDIQIKQEQNCSEKFKAYFRNNYEFPLYCLAIWSWFL